MSAPMRRLCRKRRPEDGDGDEKSTTSFRSVEIGNSQRQDSEDVEAKLSHLDDRKKPAADTKESSFQYKLYEILQCDDFKDILTWLPHGRSWKIIDSDALTQSVLPKYFRHSKYSSFKRQMSGWGFRRGIKVNEYNEYNHPMFIRDKPELLSKMKRRMQKRNDSKAKLHAASNLNSHDGKMPAVIDMPTQTAMDNIRRTRTTLLMNGHNQANSTISAVTNDQGAAIDNPLISVLNQNQVSSELSGLYSYANQIGNTSYPRAPYHPYTQRFGMLEMAQNYPTPSNVFQNNSASGIPVTSRIATQALLDNLSQSRNSHIQLSEYMNRLTSNNPISGSVLGQMTINSPIAGLATSTTFSDIQRLEQLAHLNEQRTVPNSLVTLGSSVTSPLYNLQLNPALHGNLRVMEYPNGIQGQTNLNAETLEALRRSVLSMIPQAQNNPTNFQS